MVNLSVNIKPSTDYDSPLIHIEGDTFAELQEAVGDFIDGGGASMVSDLHSLLKAAHSVLPVTNVQPEPQAPPVPAAEVAQSRWGTGTQSQPQAPQSQPSQGGPAQHPDGKTCGVCGTNVVWNVTRNGKKQWVCPQYKAAKDSQGNWLKDGNGHYVEWVG